MTFFRWKNENLYIWCIKTSTQNFAVQSAFSKIIFNWNLAEEVTKQKKRRKIPPPHPQSSALLLLVSCCTSYAERELFATPSQPWRLYQGKASCAMLFVFCCRVFSGSPTSCSAFCPACPVTTPAPTWASSCCAWTSTSTTPQPAASLGGRGTVSLVHIYAFARRESCWIFFLSNRWVSSVHTAPAQMVVGRGLNFSAKLSTLWHHQGLCSTLL